MNGYLYCAIPEEFKGINIVKLGRTCNCEFRFLAYGDLEVIKVGFVKDLIRAERELHELASVYFGKAEFHKEYYSREDLEKVIELFTEIVSKYREPSSELFEQDS
jgi:hypothetical protein